MSSLLASLTGHVRTLTPYGAHEPYGVPWSNVARYAREFEQGSAEQGVDPLLMAAMGMVESESNQFEHDGHTVIVREQDSYDQVPAVGILQVKLAYHQWRVPDADGYTVSGNIRLGAAVMADGIRQYGSWEQALVRLYFPGDDPGSGTSQNAYVQTVRSLMAEMRNQTQPSPEPEEPGPIVALEPLSVIFGGIPVMVDYGFLDDVGLNYYAYGVNHGTTRPTQHTGDDCLAPDETPLYAPAPGIVTCVGWHGNPTYGQGCGYFEDEEGGIGNISILLDTGHKIVLGHSSIATVNVGDRVVAGAPVGRSGGMNGPHTHLEVAIDKGGSAGYWLVDPQPALREAMKGSRPLPPGKVYATRLQSIPQPSELDTTATVVATTKGIKVLQYGNKDAPEVRKPLDIGEEFEASYQILGDDHRLYWITKNDELGPARVPVLGTRSSEWDESHG